MKLLYVEDEVHIRELVEMALELEDGFEIKTCEDGREALSLLRKGDFRPDAVLLDVMMAGLDGPGTLKAMREDPALAHLPVIFFTAKGRTHEHDALKALGAIGVITKPFDPLSLGEQVRALVEGAQ